MTVTTGRAVMIGPFQTQPPQDGLKTLAPTPAIARSVPAVTTDLRALVTACIGVEALLYCTRGQRQGVVSGR